MYGFSRLFDLLPLRGRKENRKKEYKKGNSKRIPGERERSSVCLNGVGGAPPVVLNAYLISEISQITCSQILTSTLQASLTSGNPISLTHSLSLSLQQYMGVFDSTNDPIIVRLDSLFLLSLI